MSSIPRPPFSNTIDELLYWMVQKLKNNYTPPMSIIPQPPFHTATERLLYEILMNLGSSIPVNYNNTLFVSSSYGNDDTAQKNNILMPYLTIAAAIENFMPGDLIHVMEGTYYEGNLNGVLNYWFDFGAVVSFNGRWGEAIFQPSYGSCTVRGYGQFICTADANAIFVGEWFGSNFDLECESIETYGNGVGCMIYQNNNFDQTLNTPIRIKARRIYGQNCSPVMFLYQSNAVVEAEELVCDSTFYPAIYSSDSSQVVIKNSKLISNYTFPYQIDGNDSYLTLDNVKFYANNPNAYANLWISNQLLTLYLKNMEFIAAGSTPCIFTNSIVLVNLDENTSSNNDTGGNPNYIVYGYKDRYIHLPETLATLDITGQANIDLSAFQNKKYIFLTSGNANETLQTINNAPQHHSFVLIPYGNLTLSIASASSLTAGLPAIVTDQALITLKGAAGDWIEFYNGYAGQDGNRIIAYKNYTP